MVFLWRTRRIFATNCRFRLVSNHGAVAQHIEASTNEEAVRLVPVLEKRRCEQELMDQPGLAVPEHQAALAALRRVNLLSTAVLHMWKALEQIARSNRTGYPIRVLDLACGGGDIAIRLARRAQRKQVPMIFHGCDVSSTAVSVAREAALKAGIHSMAVFQCDVVKGQLPRDYDVIMCSLFLHHLSDADGPAVLQAMATAARRAILVDDLLRSSLGFALCSVGCRILTRSRIVHKDGPLSVRAAYSKSEIQRLIVASGLDGAKVRYHFPQRFLLSWVAP